MAPAITLLEPGQSTTLTLRATLPAANFGSLESRFTDLRHPVRASYTIRREFTQEVQAGGLTPEVARQQEVLKLALDTPCK